MHWSEVILIARNPAVSSQSPAAGKVQCYCCECTWTVCREETDVSVYQLRNWAARTERFAPSSFVVRETGEIRLAVFLANLDMIGERIAHSAHQAAPSLRSYNKQGMNYILSKCYLSLIFVCFQMWKEFILNLHFWNEFMIRKYHHKDMNISVSFACPIVNMLTNLTTFDNSKTVNVLFIFLFDAAVINLTIMKCHVTFWGKK